MPTVRLDVLNIRFCSFLDIAAPISPQETKATSPHVKSPSSTTNTKTPEPASVVTPTVQYAQAAAAAASGHSDSHDDQKKGE
jgi:hypothetical protein